LSPDEDSPLDGGLIRPTLSVESLATTFPQSIFPDPAAELTNNMLEAMDNLCCQEGVNAPSSGVYYLRASDTLPIYAIARPKFTK
jgi:hypothetical protein